MQKQLPSKFSLLTLPVRVGRISHVFKLRIEYPGAMYHVMNCGDQREAELWARRKGHRAKVLLARRLRQETTMSLMWIAERLHLGKLDLRLQPAE